MKLGVITDGISRDLEHALKVAREFDLNYAELQFVWDKEIGDHDKTELAKIKSLLDAHGMKVPCISRHIFTGGTLQMSTKTTDAVYQGQLDSLRRCIAVAKELGSPLVRIFSGRKEMILFGKNGAEQWNVAKGAWDALPGLIEPAVKIAEEEDITLVVETGNGTMVNSSWTAAKLIDAIGSPRLKVLWDSANNCYAHERMFPEGYEVIRGKIGHIHIKDVVVDTPKATLEVREMGKGQLADQFEPAANALRADGYDGVVSFESVYHPGNGSYEDGFRACIGRFKEIFG
ncbi:sugar phosphate isomerase/epimerase family protein [Mesorhizobium australafricanum]|uniref:Sugar phosphate isomerase/epimerase family protein n=1 Tax=Mesorhizobium australafricanum TaxID=3072311 RepID=A0ABU4WVZ0_9HYPH|nr:sugar phosphate isomerase/epimerase family protein [Mesorhizobium sp. VK3E]MDX8440235.1 sugar phosphate isomerase/epimerase family protein [Mesorhizobium sp. VK3E]